MQRSWGRAGGNKNGISNLKSPNEHLPDLRPHRDRIKTMADEPRSLETRTFEDSGEGKGFEEIERLEFQVKQIAQTIRHYRTTLPDQFKKTVAQVLASQRPLLPNINVVARPGVSEDEVPDTGEHIGSTKAALLAEDDPEFKEKIRLLNLKISSNFSTMPIILKRMNECISMIDRLDSLHGTIHPAFKRKRTS